jgi:pimeloyl-ACP methyl ester carboxylesterase
MAVLQVWRRFAGHGQEGRMPGWRDVVRTIVVVGAICAGGSAAAQDGPPALDGRWEGTIDVPGGSLPFAVTFATLSSGLTGTIDVKAHRASPLAAMSVTGPTLHFELQAAKPAVAVFDGTVEANAISGSFVQGGARGTFSLTRVDAAAASAAPYRSEEVTFTNGAVTLAGTLTIPRGTGPFRALVMVTGSGAQNRDEELFGFKIFATIADHLTRHGVAVLRYDDRGVAGSTGNAAASTTADLAGDALAGVALLADRSDIDRTRVGIWGHSEGASVAALAAGRSPAVGFIVMMAPPAIRGDLLLARQQADGARGLGASPEDIATVEAAFKKAIDAIRSDADTSALEAAVRNLIAAQYDARSSDGRAALGDRGAFVDKVYPVAMAQLQSPALRDLIDSNPEPALTKVRCPVLALFGGKDVQVPPDVNRPALDAAFAKGGQVQPTVLLYPDANHLFMTAITGQPSEYASLPKAFVPGFLDDATRWLLAVR